MNAGQSTPRHILVDGLTTWRLGMATKRLRKMSGSQKSPQAGTLCADVSVGLSHKYPTIRKAAGPFSNRRIVVGVTAQAPAPLDLTYVSAMNSLFCTAPIGPGAWYGSSLPFLWPRSSPPLTSASVDAPHEDNSWPAGRGRLGTILVILTATEICLGP